MQNQISSTVKNGYQAVMNRIILEVKKGSALSDIRIMSKEHLQKMSDITTYDYNKKHFLSKELFEKTVEEEYINQNLDVSMRDFMKTIL